ncbi:MAG: DUF1707 domain-containing protein [Micropruina sp.]|uniref:DUF1707 SHOCT-like domain-containing protein n=1 Tax=Micropruina sp. TaxID=2737536 RepID=UPI0039E3F041
MSYPEPSDVGPAAGGNRPVFDSDRNQVIALLEAAYAEGRITAAEHTERIQAAKAAETFDDLVPLTRDLVALDEPTAPAPAWSRAPSQSGAEPELIVTLFGGTERRGRWQPRRNLSVLTLFGGTSLDLRQAIFTGNSCEINVFCLFGGVSVIVPEGVDVENRVTAIFGGSDVKATPVMPGTPKVVVRGFVGFGGVETRAKPLDDPDD